MRIVVLVKPVPDTASGGERLRADDWRLDRAATPAVVNANDEYALEAALKLTEAHGGEVHLLSMAGAGAPETMRKALAMGAASGTLVTDETLAGSDALSTARVLAAALRGLEFDLVFAGADTSDGGAGVVPAGVATLLRLPYLSYAAKIEPNPEQGTVRVHRISATGFDVLEAPMPALVVATQALGEPRYPSLKGIMAARSKSIETEALAELTIASSGGDRGNAGVGGDASTSEVLGADAPPPRAATRVIREVPDEAARQVVAFLAERRII
ncbi:MAG TPA: electron transfer flavoprotein subunit beta/FixA family protein [Candidatus Limnocylindrales bacterium]|nr:electron transfer flavoprotein subunit beta/FixA family protein [Candidatus Limnocylindrales bacterium]